MAVAAIRPPSITIFAALAFPGSICYFCCRNTNRDNVVPESNAIYQRGIKQEKALLLQFRLKPFDAMPCSLLSVCQESVLQGNLSCYQRVSPCSLQCLRAFQPRRKGTRSHSCPRACLPGKEFPQKQDSLTSRTCYDDSGFQINDSQSELSFITPRGNTGMSFP